MNGLRQECACGRVSDTYGLLNPGPQGWLVGYVFWEGRYLHFAACSADCVNLVKEQTKQHLRGEAERGCRAVDNCRLERVK